MPAALWSLLGLHFRATARRWVRGVGTVRGVCFLALGLLAMFAWLGPSLYHAAKMPPTDPRLVLAIAPLAILGFCLGNLFTAVGEKAVAFTGAEVDFLFPGPFSRRSLLGYKILKTALGTLLTTLIFALMLRRYSSSWTACVLGIWLTIQFMQLFAMAVMMVGQTVGQRVQSGARRAVLLAMAALAIIAAAPTLAAHLHRQPLQFLEQVHATIAGRVLLAPFDVFARTFAAGAPAAHLAQWASLALLIDLLMLAIVIGLDANYLETAAAASQRRYERMQRFRRGGIGTLSAGAGTRMRIIPLPWLGGTGPIAWRQLTGALRSWRSLLIVLVIIGIVAGTVIMQRNGPRQSSLAPLIGVVAWMNVLFISMLRFDFRDELDRLDLLRSLPIRPWAVAAAELFTPVLALTAMQALLLAGLVICFGGIWRFVLPAAAFAVPFNVLLAGIENLLFLLFPLRSAGLIAGDMQLFGRQMVVFLCKFLLLLAGLAAAAVGLVGYILGRQSWPAFAAAAWVGLSLVALGSIAMLARVYSKFDPSVQTPP